MWVVRNKEGVLELWKNKPYRTGSYWSSANSYPLCDLSDGSFPNLKWEDEPLEVELKVKSKPKKIGTYGWQEECDRCQN